MQSEGLTIRRLVVSDSAALSLAVSQNRAYLGQWLDTPDRLSTVMSAENALSDPAVVRFGAFIDGALKGSAKVMLGPPTELGLWVTEDVQGLGVGFALARTALEYAREIGNRTVLYCCDRSNDRSVRLQERLADLYSSYRVDPRGSELCWHINVKG